MKLIIDDIANNIFHFAFSLYPAVIILASDLVKIEVNSKALFEI